MSPVSEYELVLSATAKLTARYSTERGELIEQAGREVGRGPAADIASDQPERLEPV